MKGGGLAARTRRNPLPFTHPRKCTSLQEGQRRLANSLHTMALRCVPADGDCFYHSVRTIVSDKSITALRREADNTVPGEWAEEENMWETAMQNNLAITCVPIDLHRFNAGLQLQSSVVIHPEGLKKL